jgi:ABC-type sugar transport system ATPase subunit
MPGVPVPALWRDATTRRPRPRALVRPEVLLLDEPFSAVDAMTREMLQGELARLWEDPQRRQTTAILVTHDLDKPSYSAIASLCSVGRPGECAWSWMSSSPSPDPTRSPVSSGLPRAASSALGRVTRGRSPQQTSESQHSSGGTRLKTPALDSTAVEVARTGRCPSSRPAYL